MKFTIDKNIILENLMNVARAISTKNVIPVLNGINRMLGIAAGLIKGMVGVWVFLAVVAFFSSSEAGISLLKYIYEAPAVQWMYENNLVMNLILMFL